VPYELIAEVRTHVIRACDAKGFDRAEFALNAAALDDLKTGEKSKEKRTVKSDENSNRTSSRRATLTQDERDDAMRRTICTEGAVYYRLALLSSTLKVLSMLLLL
jgi:hypothetical protein